MIISQPFSFMLLASLEECLISKGKRWGRNQMTVKNRKCRPVYRSSWNFRHLFSHLHLLVCNRFRSLLSLNDQPLACNFPLEKDGNTLRNRGIWRGNGTTPVWSEQQLWRHRLEVSSNRGLSVACRRWSHPAKRCSLQAARPLFRTPWKACRRSTVRTRGIFSTLTGKPLAACPRRPLCGG